MMKIIQITQIFALFIFNQLQILSGSLDNQLKLWNFNSGLMEKSITQAGPINSIKVSRGQQDLISTPDCQPIILDNTNQQDQVQLTDDNGSTAIAISDCGTIAVIVTLDEKIKIVDLKTFETIETITLKMKSKRKMINSISITQNLKQIVVALDYYIIIYSFETGAHKQIKTFSYIDKMKIIKQENIDLIITGHENGQIFIHNFSGNLQRSVKMHNDHIISMDAKNNMIVSCGFNGELSVYEIGDLNKPLGSITDKFDLLGCKVTSLSLTGDILVAGCEGGQIILFNIKSRQILKIIDGHQDSVTSIAISLLKK